MMLLSAEKIHACYGAVEVLKGISFDVSAGEIVALIGANGAGKSTTLMAVSGIVPVNSGKIKFNGEPIQALSTQKRVGLGITQVPEGRRIFPQLTVLENLEIGASLRTDKAEIARDMERAFSIFPVLKQRRGQLGGTLSGGEQQMLAVARGLMARPKLLLLDEPSLGLAPKAVAALFEVIREIPKNGIAVLLVEQNAYQALSIAHRAYVLETGTISLQGSSAELRQNPGVKKAYLGG